MPGPGRKTKLTPELQARFVQVARAGNFVDTCCDYVGIHPDTYYHWMERAKEGGPRNKIYEDFARAVTTARATAEVESVARIRLAGSKGNLKADIWYLERTHPDKWGRNRVELTGKDGTPLHPPTPTPLAPDASYEEVMTKYQELLDGDH